MDFNERQIELVSLIAAASTPEDVIRYARELVMSAAYPEDGYADKMRIYVNRSLDKIWTPNKRAAHVAHAALMAFGVHPGTKIVVLDAGPTKIEKMRTHVKDAGHTELEPGTLTAGTNWPEDSEP